MKNSLKLIDYKTFEKTSPFFMLKPSKGCYAFILTVLVVLAAVFIWAAVAPFDEVVDAPAVLRTLDVVSSVKCVTSGQMVQKAYVNDMYVKQGDFLFSLDVTNFEKQRESYALQLAANQENLDIYSALLKTIELDKIPENLVENPDSKAYLVARDYLLQKKNYSLAVSTALNALEKEKAMTTYHSLAFQIKELETEYEKQKLQAETWVNSQHMNALNYVTQYEKEKIIIESTLADIDRTIQNATITAPISGRVAEMTRLNVGDYILSGTEVLKIVPEDADALIADIYVNAASMPLVKTGNPVLLKFPGLPPSRYGQLETTVSVIPPDASSVVDGNAVFIIQALIENPVLRAKDGEEAVLLPGIAASAKIATGRDTVLRMILKKLDFLH